jgi:hypothetical protein
MSAICQKGTIINIVGRGIDETPFHMALFEPIDDAEHSESKRVFVDINVHEKSILIGFENSATEEQINNMVKWNQVSEIHNTNNLCTVGQGLKHFLYQARGKVVNYSLNDNLGKYYESSANTYEIYKEAINRDGSESKFNEIFSKYTKYVDIKELDEMPQTIRNIIYNLDGVYPFSPKTLMQCKQIDNDSLLDHLKDEKNISILRKELYSKYFHEICCENLELYCKMPNHLEFEKFECNKSFDVVGSTIKRLEHNIDIYQANLDADGIKKNELLLCINRENFYNVRKNGTSYIRTRVFPSEKDINFLFRYTQYHFQDDKVTNDKLKENIVGTSLEIYSGVYVSFGKKFINGKPITSTIVTRNLQGSKHYRGIMDIQNPETKNKLQIHGLKAKFNLANMKNIEDIIKQCTIIYKNYCKCLENNKNPLPDDYTVVNSSNKKTDKTSKSDIVGIDYILKVGDDFYKVGHSGSKNKAHRLLGGYFTDEEIEKVKEDFPNEKLYPKHKMHFVFLPPCEIKNSKSLEQKLKEIMVSDPDIITYDHKNDGDDIREFFHCNKEKLDELIEYFKENSIPHN